MNHKSINRVIIVLFISMLFVSACDIVREFNLPAILRPQSTTVPSSNNPTVEGTVIQEIPTSAPSAETPTITSTPEPVLTATYTPNPTFTETSTPAATNTPAPQEPLVFAAIGDYGSGDEREGDVANLVKSWDPELIITLGDNNYQLGEAATIDANIGQFYHEYIYPYTGTYGEGADENRFFPVLGNHDLMTNNGQAYFDYFKLPGNERYYDFTWGPVEFFALNDNDSEPDGVGLSSAQAAWLKDQLASSTTPWQIVYMHNPPYSSGYHGPTDWAQWPYQEWGADAVLSGNDHSYERLDINGVPFIINGLGGIGYYDFQGILPESQARYTGEYGALRMEATDQYIKFDFINRNGELIDTYEVRK